MLNSFPRYRPPTARKPIKLTLFNSKKRSFTDAAFEEASATFARNILRIAERHDIISLSQVRRDSASAFLSSLTTPLQTYTTSIASSKLSVMLGGEAPLLDDVSVQTSLLFRGWADLKAFLAEEEYWSLEEAFTAAFTEEGKSRMSVGEDKEFMVADVAGAGRRGAVP